MVFLFRLVPFKGTFRDIVPPLNVVDLSDRKLKSDLLTLI